jgi:hypothetical protein
VVGVVVIWPSNYVWSSWANLLIAPRAAVVLCGCGAGDALDDPVFAFNINNFANTHRAGIAQVFAAFVLAIISSSHFYP